MKPIKDFGLITLFILPSSLWAATTNWVVLPEQSQIKFTATQNNAPVKGEFKRFSGQLSYDEDKLQEARAEINVEAGSLFTSYNVLRDALKGAEWLDSTQFPQATFKGKGIVKKPDGSYEMQGQMHIRSKEHPQTINFKLSPEPQNKIAQGKLTLKRLDYDLGQGDWANLTEIKNEVDVEFKLVLKKQ